jgi:hypothetical protein
MGSKTRMVIMVVTSILAAATVVWVQGRYEKGDMRNALKLVQTYRSRTGVSVPDRLSYRHPGKGVQWSTAVENSCFQHVRVAAVVSEDPAKEPVVYAFSVDINGPSIHPANDNGKVLLTELDQPPPKASAAASSEAAAK